MRNSANAPVRQTYDRLAAVYDRRWARYIRATTRATLARLALRPGEQLLDLGCGTGALLRELVLESAAPRLCGVDLSLAMLACARASLPPAVPLALGDVGALPYPSGSFDVVVSISSFHYWPHPEEALQEIRRVLRPGGRLVITDWCADFLACRICEWIVRRFDHAHQRIYGKARCRQLLEAAGLAEVAVESYSAPWPWGMMTATARVAAT
ncbi:MAG TPA: methyltransferase domain-containing protein [Thermoanaerobaculia bacterium]|nr:methyltransferase domain-containing protein [Thermoanaerobaculia bacterium]